MFDLGFSEILLIGLVALLVLGPERLPRVARTAGRFFSKARGYYDQIKDEIDEQARLEDVKQIREAFAKEAQSLKQDVQNVADDVKEDLPFSTFNLSEETMSSSSSFPFEEDFSHRYKAQASVDELIDEIASLRDRLRLPPKALIGNNRRWSRGARINKARIYR